MNMDPNGDELNIIRAGVNYGWPVITYGVNYDGTTISTQQSAPGLAQPLMHWSPSIAPSGMAFYWGDAFPEWRGDVFIGALAKRHLLRLRLRGSRVVAQEKLLKGVARVRDVEMGPDGALYVLFDHASGRLVRLVP